MYGSINIWNPVSPWQLKVIISNRGIIIKSVWKESMRYVTLAAEKILIWTGTQNYMILQKFELWVAGLWATWSRYILLRSSLTLFRLFPHPRHTHSWLQISSLIMETKCFAHTHIKQKAYNMETQLHSYTQLHYPTIHMYNFNKSQCSV